MNVYNLVELSIQDHPIFHQLKLIHLDMKEYI